MPRNMVVTKHSGKPMTVLVPLGTVSDVGALPEPRERIAAPQKTSQEQRHFAHSSQSFSPAQEAIGDDRQRHDEVNIAGGVRDRGALKGFTEVIRANQATNHTIRGTIDAVTLSAARAHSLSSMPPDAIQSTPRDPSEDRDPGPAALDPLPEDVLLSVNEYITPTPTNRKIKGKRGLCRTYFDSFTHAIRAPPSQLLISMNTPAQTDLFVFFVNDYSITDAPQVWIYEMREGDDNRRWHSVDDGEERHLFGEAYYLSVQRSKRAVSWVALWTYKQRRREDA
ncbi:hypothetical protein HDZ31DRAFT_76093 [Schizophyllum fasciatum]